VPVVQRPCLDCPQWALPDKPRCATHQRQQQRQRDLRRQRPTTTARGYDAHHQALRAKLLPLAIGTPCRRCHQPMLAHQQLDLGHPDNPDDGRAIEHAICNRGGLQIGGEAG
jgi:hypothetical protein